MTKTHLFLTIHANTGKFCSQAHNRGDNRMFGGLYVSGALTGLLKEYLDAEGLSASVCHNHLAQWSQDSRIPLADWRALLDEVALVDPRPALGLAIGHRVAPRHAGVMGYLGQSCETLGEALLRFERYHRLVYDGNPAAISIHGDIVSISWGIEHGYPGQLADETAIAVFATLMRQLVNEPLTPVMVNFVNPAPPDIRPYEAFFRCPVTFGGILTYVSFPQSYLTLRIQHSDPGLRHLLESQAEALLRALPNPDPFAQALKVALVRCLHNGNPALEQIAQQLHISARTLQRRLDERDLKFQPLLDRTRAELARGYLLDANLSLTEIALLLGYSEQSAFNRAFKRWTGQTPKSLRRYR